MNVETVELSTEWKFYDSCIDVHFFHSLGYGFAIALTVFSISQHETYVEIGDDNSEFIENL